MFPSLFKDDEYVLHAGVWIKFYDAHGWGYAQPDIVVLSRAKPLRGAIFEAKRTRCQEAEEQLKYLYYPLCSFVWPGRHWTLVQACRHWAGGAEAQERFLTSPVAAFAHVEPQPTASYFWHFIGGVHV